MVRYPSLRDPVHTQARWALAERVADAVRDRHAADVRAIWVHGALAHHTDDAGAIELMVVTFLPGTGPRPAARRVDGTIVDLAVVSADECLELARSLTPSWPLAADRYVTGRPLHDPEGWHDRIRDVHLGRLAEAGDGEFAAVAREAWCEASASRARAISLAEWHDTDGAMLTLGGARLAAALVEGLLNRTYFRSPADAVTRTGLGGAGLVELAERLEAQADELAKRGYPVDGDAASLLD